MRTCKCGFTGDDRLFIRGNRCRKCDNKMVDARRATNREKWFNLINMKCEICGYDKCTAAIEFHHIDPSEKRDALANLLKKYSPTGPNVNKVWEELDKCQILCANCHREVHN